MYVVADFNNKLNVKWPGNNRSSTMRVIQFCLKSGSGTVKSIFENVHFSGLRTGSQITESSGCNPCGTPLCGTSRLFNCDRRSGEGPLRKWHCFWTRQETHHPDQLWWVHHTIFQKWYQSQGEWRMGVTLEFMMIENCCLIGLMMVKQNILWLLTLEVEYGWWCLKLANIDV